MADPKHDLGKHAGFQGMATSLMKQTFANKGVATVEELRDMAVELDVQLIGCQMTMDVFGFTKDEFIDEVEVGGAATFLELPPTRMSACSWVTLGRSHLRQQTHYSNSIALKIRPALMRDSSS